VVKKTAFSRQLSAVSHQLSAVSFQLSAISYQPSAISRQLSAFSHHLSAFSLLDLAYARAGTRDRQSQMAFDFSPGSVWKVSPLPESWKLRAER
jgi:hypothetical protein